MNVEAVSDYCTAKCFGGGKEEAEGQRFLLTLIICIERTSTVRNEAIMEGNESSDWLLN